MKVFPSAAVDEGAGRLPAQGVPLARPARPQADDPGRAGRLHRLRRLCRRLPGQEQDRTSHKAINMEPVAEHRDIERPRWDFFQSIPQLDRSLLAHDTVKGSQMLEPLFEFSGACAGCGETPYLRLVSQLFGDRMIIANATGCSSIYGGNLPTTPWTVNAAGRGPAWSNSLFEDNAEFGLGMRLALDAQTDQARQLLARLAPELGAELVAGSSTRARRPKRRSSSSAPGRALREPSAGSTGRPRSTPGTCWRSPATSSARASGSSAATAGPMTSGSAASTRSSRRAATSTSWSSTPRSTRTRAARPRRRRRAARSPSSPPPARARPRRTSARSPGRTATSTSPRSRWAPTTSRRPRRCSRPMPGRDRRWSSPTAPASRTGST